MNKGVKIIGCIVLGGLFVFAVGSVTMVLWNWLIPSLFGGPFIQFWQAIGLLLLSKILFSGFHKGGCCNRQHHASSWRGKLHNKFSNMSPEEREAFKKKMKDKWCNYERGTSSENTDSSNG